MTDKLKFGTSGLRGLVSALTDEICARYTLGFLNHLMESRFIKPQSTLLVGMDLRASSPRIAKAVMNAASSHGHHVINAGAVPTPALALAAQTKAVPAIMVTGSHIPEDRNGLKFYRPDGEITKMDEAGIINALPDSAALDPSYQIPAICDDVLLQYKNRCLSILPKTALQGLNIGIYQHSSVARDLLVDIVSQLGANAIPLYRADHFIPVDTEALRDEDRRLAIEGVSNNGLDAFISTDGDADRPLIAGSNSIFLKGDMVGLLSAQYLGAHAVATPVTSSSTVETCDFFDEVYRCRVGSPYVIEAMREAKEDGFKTIVGFEANGGVLLGSSIETETSTVEALSTRDAILPILCVLGLAQAQSLKIEHLLDNIPKRFTASGRLQNIDRSKAMHAMAHLEDATTRIHYFHDIGIIKQWDVIDGYRFIFKNGDILHYRMSGNAPELRCYSESTTQKQADDLMQWGLENIAKHMEA